LPIEPNCVGKTIDADASEHVEVRFADTDGEDAVFVRKGAVPCT
jgi:pyrimidine operon attenuation protein/uracil phosphoribosyltransferase